MPAICRPGFRYLLAILFESDPSSGHTLAVDESGIVFDPLDESSRKLWFEYAPSGLLELLAAK